MSPPHQPGVITSSSGPFGAVASIKAGFAYALIVFVAGFVLGTLRVLLVVPRLGATTGVLLEAPLILTASWLVSRWCTEHFRVRADVGARVLVGTIAFVTLMCAEIALSVVLFHKSVSEHLAGYQSVPGAIGLAAQVCFASFPLIQARIQRRSGQDS
jgi:hypothetical protein